MRLTSIMAILLIVTGVIIGQTNRGAISGTVTDSNGAIIPAAKVTITNAGTNQSITVITTADGAFTASSLDPVTYTITAEASNFKKSVVPGVKVDTATTQTVNISLEAGNINETVTVEAGGVLINTESGATGQTITERQLRELPLSNRSVLDLAVTVSNVAGDAGSEDAEVTSGQPVPGFNLSLNGGRPGGGSILADGANNTGVGLGRAIVSFTPETVQEFTVQTSAYSAEYGNTSGGVINATTKSGTNQFGGTLLWYHRNPATNAQPYRIGTTPRTPNNLRYNQASVTVGGPIFLPKYSEGAPKWYDGRGKSFFFFAYEPRWRNDFITTTTLLPTAAERAGDFRGLRRTTSGWLPEAVAAQFNIASTGAANIYQQFNIVNGRLVPIVLGGTNLFCQFGQTPNTNATNNPMLPNDQCTAATLAVPNLNVLPSQFIDPVAKQILTYMPDGGNYFLDNGFVRNHIVNRQVTQNETRYTLRLDHNITDKNKVNFRYTMTPAIAIRDFGTDVNGNTGVYSDAKQILVGNDHIFSANIVNNLRVNYTRGVFSEDFSPEFSIMGGRNLATELGLPSLTDGGLPLFQISGDSGNGYNAFADVGSSGSTNNANTEERYSVSDVVYWTNGAMTWKFGGEFSLAKLQVTPFFGASGGRWEFRTLNTSNNRTTNLPNGGNNLASMLIGVPNAVQVRPLLLEYNYNWKNFAAFVQNDWKVRQNLTLNLGMRYSLQTPRAEENNLQGVFRPDLAQSVNLTERQRLDTAAGLGVIPANSPLGTVIPAPYNSQIPTSVKIPVYAFAGRGGRSKYLVPMDYLGFEPRFGFAWSPKMFKWFEDRSAVVRGGFGISHAPLTGNNRLPNPDFGGFQAVSTTATGSSVGGTADATQPVRLTGNFPVINGVPLDQTFGISPDGLVTTNSIGVVGFAYAGDDSGAVPYSQNWNLSFSFEVFKNMALEVAYVGAKGTHLYMPLTNINPRDINFVEGLEAANINAETTFADPLGRRNALGTVVQIQRNSVTSPFFGFGSLERYFDPSANSIRHAGYVEVRKRFSDGLSFTANYTYGKSIDDASDASPDVRVLTTGTTRGQAYYGAPRSGDRAISAFDIKHNFNSTFVWDLPFGKDRWLLKNAPGFVDAILGGWTASGVYRLMGGQPYTPFITDTNRLGGLNRSIRMDVVEGQPLLNPLWDRTCPVGAGCEPYLNPAAFKRPAKGSLGNSGRTVDLRSPSQNYFDFSIQKSFKLPFISDEGRRRINFRVDLLNAFNTPVFRYNNTGNTPFGFGTYPTEFNGNECIANPGLSNCTGVGTFRTSTISPAEYDAWANANGQPLSSTPAGQTILGGIRTMVNGTRLPTGALPLPFFSIAVPQGFATRAATSFDIRTLEGFKHYRLRQTYDTNFGTLFSPQTNPRYIQFGVRIFF